MSMIEHIGLGDHAALFYRTREEQSNVIASLETAHDSAARDSAASGTARLMREQGLGVKKQGN